MDSKNQNNSSGFMAIQPLKKMIPQLLLSVSLFSLVISYLSLNSSSSLLYCFPKSHYFSANYFQPLSHTLNKNFLFLICNGLLVFLAKTSGFIQPPSHHYLEDLPQKGIDNGLQTALDKYVLEENAPETKDEEEKGESEKPKQVSIFIAESEEEGGDCDLDNEEKDENQNGSRRYRLFYDDEQQLYGEEAEEEDDDEEEEGKKEEMSTEELNQKFEDFIRRMKKEIIINEARQKVVMVK